VIHKINELIEFVSRVFMDPTQCNESQNTMGHIDDFPFEVGAVVTKVLGHFAKEQGSVAHSPEEADFYADCF
jgi:hypothetical protein